MLGGDFFSPFDKKGPCSNWSKSEAHDMECGNDLLDTLIKVKKV